MHPDISVVGGGLLGRCLAWRAARAGAHVALYEASSSLGESSAAWAAAGMITPTAEAADSDLEIVAMGRHSLTLWPSWLEELPYPIFYRNNGTLVLWHRDQAGDARRFERTLRERDTAARIVHVEAAGLDSMEPSLAGAFRQALYLAGEAQVDNRELLKVLATALEETRVECHWSTSIRDDSLPDGGVVVDCRGMGAAGVWPRLRGVRGEIVRLDAPEIELTHMLRLIHPRYAVYVVPRARGRLVVGATSIESNDRSPVSVRGALELLSSAFTLLPALAEARIVEFATQVRPTLPDNRPAFRFSADRRVLRINGLYRHGFLLSPTVVEAALAVLGVQESSASGRWPCLELSAREEVDSCLSL